jgi:hypothetical protein
MTIVDLLVSAFGPGLHPPSLPWLSFTMLQFEDYTL